jgi:ATP-binding cassette subfamily F protein uup
VDPVGDLSGGERRRLQILRLLMGEPNVILLDEPTNDLDIDTLNALEDLLDGWPGTLIVVSHDRYFLERVTTVTASLMGDGSIARCPAAWRSTSPSGSRRRPPPRRRARAAVTPGRPRRSCPASSGRSPGWTPARSRSRRDGGKAADFAAVARLDEELRTLQADRSALEDSWLELYEASEA